jgi:hypothetical protein
MTAGSMTRYDVIGYEPVGAAAIFGLREVSSRRQI